MSWVFFFEGYCLVTQYFKCYNLISEKKNIFALHPTVGTIKSCLVELLI